MIIGVNCFLLQPHVGGIKQYFLTLFDWLLANDLKNEYVFFYAADNLIELSKLKSQVWRSSSVLLSSQDGIADHFSKLDLYFCPFNTLWPRPVPLPSVLTLVDIQEVYFPEFFASGDVYQRALHYPASTRAADRVVTISQFSKESISNHHRISPSKIVIAHLCADPLFLQPAENNDSDANLVPFDKFLFFPANRWRHKNHDTLLRALKILRDEGHVANCVFTGYDVPEGYPLLAKAIEYGVADCIFSAGYITLAQLAELYRSAEIMVFPSLFEGFGIPPIEAMTLGCPVLAASSTCLPEICGDAAEFFDATDPVALANAIIKLRADPKRRESLIRSGRSRATHFSAEAMARAHLRAFHEAVESYSALRFLWHKRFYQPFHRWRVNKINVLGLPQSKSLLLTWPKKMVQQGAQLTIDFCELPFWLYRFRGLSQKIRTVEASGLFQPDFYDSQVHLGFGVSRVGHYLLHGSKDGLDPNPVFSERWYLKRNPDVAEAGISPLVHFILFGAQEGRDPHPLFDISWYLDQYPDVRNSGHNPLKHYLHWGAAEGRNPHPLFDAAFYLSGVSDYNLARLNPLAHYLSQEPLKANDPHPSFDARWYLLSNRDVAEARINPLVHYVTVGLFEGRLPKQQDAT